MQCRCLQNGKCMHNHRVLHKPAYVDVHIEGSIQTHANIHTCIWSLRVVEKGLDEVPIPATETAGQCYGTAGPPPSYHVSKRGLKSPWKARPQKHGLQRATAG